MIQLIDPKALWFNSVSRDFERWGLPKDTIIEMAEAGGDKLFRCLAATIYQGFSTAREQFHEEIARPFESFAPFMFEFVVKGRLDLALRFILADAQRNGLRWELLSWCFPKLAVYAFRRVVARVQANTR
jgi:hypothetical protein